MHKILTVVLSFIFLQGVTLAQTPFEKKGKWGLFDSITGKTIMKPKYKMLKKSGIPGRFVAVDDLKGFGEVTGVVDVKGNEVVPFSSEYEGILPYVISSGYGTHSYSFLLVMKGEDGNVLKCSACMGYSPGELKELLKKHPVKAEYFEPFGKIYNRNDGWYLMSLNEKPKTSKIYKLSQSREGDMQFELGRYHESVRESHNLWLVSNDFKKAQPSMFFNDKYILLHGVNDDGYLPEGLYDRNSLEIALQTDSRRILKYKDKALLINYDKTDDTYRLVDLNTAEIFKDSFKDLDFSNKYSNRTIYENMDTKYCSTTEGPFVNALIIMGSNGNGVAIDEEGNVHRGRIFFNSFKIPDSKNTENTVLLEQTPDGKYIVDGYTCDSICPFDYMLYAYRVNGKWGISAFNNEYKKDDVIKPVFPNLPLPTRKENKHYGELYIASVGEYKEVYNQDGETIMRYPSGYDMGVLYYNDDLVSFYKIEGNSSGVRGIYNLCKREWIVPISDYGKMDILGSERVVHEISPNKWEYLEKDGKVISTYDGVVDIHGFLGNLLSIVDTNGKLGFIDSHSGRWLQKCQYDNDYEIGRKDPNGLRRFCVQKTGNNGETLYVFYDNGSFITSKYFPFGTSKILVEQWGYQVLF